MDITEIHEKNRLLSYSEAKYRAIMEQAGEMLFLHDMQGHVIEVNHAATARTGYSCEELFSKTVFDIDPDARDRIDKETLWEQVCSSDKKTFEARHITKTGEIYPVEVTIGKIEVQEEHYILALVRDITLRKAAELDLQRSELHAKALLQAIPDMIFLLDQHGIYLDYKGPLGDLYQSQEVFIGKNVMEVLPKEVAELSIEFLDRTLQTNSIQNFEYQLEMPGKELGCFECRMIPYADSGVLAMVQDITERKHSEDAIRRSEEQLKALNGTKDKLFSIIAHDLRTPFNGIVGFSELLKQNAPKLDVNEIIQYASLIHVSSQNTLNLLDNLLNWARLQQNATGFSPRRILLYEAVNEAMLVPCQVANQKNITITNNVSSAAIVVADEQMLSVLLRNLISNAIKFSHPCSEVIVESMVLDGETHVSVIDQGVGIAPEDIENLFDITSSFSTRGTGNESGTGLGLTLCKDIIEKHQGRIWVKSLLEQGSTFSFSLPEKVCTE